VSFGSRPPEVRALGLGRSVFHEGAHFVAHFVELPLYLRHALHLNIERRVDVINGLLDLIQLIRRGGADSP
jgi:hypothetical protein